MELKCLAQIRSITFNLLCDVYYMSRIVWLVIIGRCYRRCIRVLWGRSRVTIVIGNSGNLFAKSCLLLFLCKFCIPCFYANYLCNEVIYFLSALCHMILHNIELKLRCTVLYTLVLAILLYQIILVGSVWLSCKFRLNNLKFSICSKVGIYFSVYILFIIFELKIRCNSRCECSFLCYNNSACRSRNCIYFFFLRYSTLFNLIFPLAVSSRRCNLEVKSSLRC